jgi:heme exporter protein A
MAAALESQGLGRRYGRRWAVARLDLVVPEGERLLVFGQNGGGKTTLLRLLSTALRPTRGTLRVFGLDTVARPDEVRSSLALVTHLPGHYEDLSASENLRILARLAGKRDDSGAWLDAVGLEPRPDPVRTYSAGMRKRLSFARLLAQKPRLALLDEPYGQLDPAGFVFVEKLLDDLRRDGMTVVIASHQVERASFLCDRAILLHQGLLRWDGPARLAPRAWTALQGVEPSLEVRP